MARISALLKKTSLLFIILGILGVFFINIDYLYNSKYFAFVEAFVTKIPKDLINEFDFNREFKSHNLSDEDYIDLLMSGDDLNHISKSMEVFIDEGFIRDKNNPWRKAKILINQKKEKIEYKFQGTSVTPLTDSIFFQLRKKVKKLGIFDSIKPPPISEGGFSLKIKHKKESNYYNLMRRYKLISHHDDSEISTIIINKIAADHGLLAPHGRLVILRINGSEIGSYMLVEAHNKEWFEREHKLTEYTIFKSNDDWDRKTLLGHVSDTDLFKGNKKISTISDASPHALGALELLLKSIRDSDINQIKEMIDMDYMAKYMAFLTITNNNHPVTGDNRRYIYNHATGKFKLLFRIESTIYPNNQSINDFNRSFFMAPHNAQDDRFPTLKLFKLLLTDTEFIVKRDKALFKIIQKSDDWENLFSSIYSKNIKILMASQEPIKPVKAKMKKFKKNIINNINKAKQYLNYNKLFLTEYKDADGKISLHALNDFTHPIMMKISSKKNNLMESEEFLIQPSQVDIDQNMVYEEQSINTRFKNSEDLVFKNIITNKLIPEKHIYFNKAIERPLFSKETSLDTLKENKISYQINNINKTIILDKQVFHIQSNVIFPYGYDVVILSGTSLLLDKSVSILFRGGLDIRGSHNQPVIVKRKTKENPFGVIALAGEGENKTQVNIQYLKFSGGGEAIINGSRFTGQMSINDANVEIKNSIFENSSSDDGINIKFSKVTIDNSVFKNNSGDQIDLDYCHGVVTNSTFSYRAVKNELISTDGLDLSGSKVEVSNNSFFNFSDKAISIGEKSNIIILNNEFFQNNLAVAVKDGSTAFLGENNFEDNIVDISMYIKKKIYSKPTLYSTKENESLNIQKKIGDVIYKNNLLDIFEAK
jgi:hypothetical protein